MLRFILGHKFNDFLNSKSPIIKEIQKYFKNHQISMHGSRSGSLKYTMIFKLFFLSYFGNIHFYFLDRLMDDCHLDYITKLKKERKKSTHWAEPTKE